MSDVGSSDTLRSVIDAGRSSKRLDELSSARVIGKIALLVHAAQQKAGAGKAIGPITPARVAIGSSGEVTLEAPAATPARGYSSPEQLTSGSGDRRSDVFSLGTVMWEALTHARLFDAMNDAAVEAAVQNREIVPPAEINANIPAELSAICMRALARNPADRYQSLKAMAVEIEEFLEEAGYTDDDAKIAQFVAGIPRADAPPTKTGTLPPPVAKQLPTTTPLGGAAPIPAMPRAANASTPQPASTPATPSILTAEPDRAKRPSGADLAKALASAGSSSAGGLPAASSSATAVGVPAAPVASEWQDRSPAPHAAAPAAAAPAPLAPLPPVLPSGSQNGARPDKSTVIGVAPILVKPAAVPTNGATNGATIEAKHVEAKPQALIVDDKPKAQIVDDEPAKQAEDTKATLVDATPPALINAAEDAKKLANKDDARTASLKVKRDDDAKPDAKPDAKADAKVDAKVEAKIEKGAEKSKPNPVDVVSLPNRESKGDLLAGWGWGTGKHDAVAPAGYVPDDDDDDLATAAATSKKTLTYVIGGGLAVALLIIVVAFAAGGGKDKKVSAREKEKLEQQAAIDKAKAEEAERKKREQAEAPAPVVQPENVTAGSGSAQAAAVDPAAQQAEADRLAAEKAAADKAAADAATAQAASDKAAADMAKADETERAKAEAARAKADAEIAAAKVKADADALRKAEADRKKLEADEKKAAEKAKQEEAKRLAAEEATRKKAEADAKKAEAAAKKAEARRVAQEEAARKKAEADAARAAKAEAAKTAKANAPATTTTAAKRPDKATTTPKTVAAAETKKTTTTTATTTPEPPKSDVNPETAYRQGLQAFARGDTAGALTSLRSSLSANPNYAPTWRGLGLVFEKMGEKDQARAAYKRYLQLAPSAGDAEIIKGRLEKLGT